MAQVEVEFYGVARLRAGVPGTTASGHSLESVWHEIARQFPALAAVPWNKFLFSINGERFVSDFGTPIDDGTRLLVLSADAGG